MDQWKPSEEFFQRAVTADLSGGGFHRPTDHCTNSDRLQINFAGPSQRVEPEVKDSIAARKVQKADREKLRRDRLNEQFLELGKILDPDRPKNDKATILNDTIQTLKDLAAQVNGLKAEYASLSEESCELTQEKNELREEKCTLKSDIDNLNAQYQQRLSCMYPPVVMGPPPPYPYPMPLPVSSGPIPMHPSLQPYSFFRTYPSAYTPQAEQPPVQRAPQNPYPSSRRSRTANRQDSTSKSSDHGQHSGAERSGDYSDVATELELKTPGSASPSISRASHDQDLSSKEMNGKPRASYREELIASEGSVSSRSSVSTGSGSTGSGSEAEY